MGRLQVFLVFLGVLLVGAIDDSDTDHHWDKYKEKYNKTYDNELDEQKSRDQFEDNLLKTALHNMEDKHNYTKNLNDFSDLNTKEAIEILCGLDQPVSNDTSKRQNYFTERLSQSEVDWVKDGRVTKVKHQGSCGSCWTFAASQALEGQAAAKWGQLYEISEQQLVDCAASYGNHGCDGGWPSNAYKYMVAKGGMVMDYCYPYTGEVGTCNVKDDCYHFKVKDYVEVGPSGDEDAVAEALAKNGPLSIAIYVSDDFMQYSGGIYHDNDCDHGVNHGVLLVGYGTDASGQAYWKLKNSWGTGWGEDGYMRIERNSNNMCKIASYAAYPVMA